MNPAVSLTEESAVRFSFFGNNIPLSRVSEFEYCEFVDSITATKEKIRQFYRKRGTAFLLQPMDSVRHAGQGKRSGCGDRY